MLEGLAEDLRGFRSQVSEEYVKTDDFEELLEETLQRVERERMEEKRKIYRAFLSQSVKDPGTPYDELMRVLRIFEQLQPGHLKVLRALDIEPGDTLNAITGSPIQTLSSRIPELREETIEELVGELNDLRVTRLERLRTMMTPRGAADLRHCITPLGQSLMRYIRDGSGESAA